MATTISLSPTCYSVCNPVTLTQEMEPIYPTHYIQASPVTVWINRIWQKLHHVTSEARA